MKRKLDIGLLLLRVVPNGLMLTHGFPKLLNFATLSSSFPDPLGIGSAGSLIGALVGEVLCPILMIVGYHTRWAALPALFTMVIAAFVIHGADPLQKKELALLYGTLYLVLAFTGGGRYSVKD